MSESLLGMNVEEVRRTAQSLRSKSIQLKRVEREVNSIVGQINGRWAGGGARRFVGNWEGSYRAGLNDLAGAVDKLADKLVREAAEQQRTSAPGAVGAGGGAGGLNGSGGGKGGGGSGGGWFDDLRAWVKSTRSIGHVARLGSVVASATAFATHLKRLEDFAKAKWAGELARLLPEGSKITGQLISGAKVIGHGAAGLGVVFGGISTVENIREGDETGAVIAGIGTVASGAALAGGIIFAGATAPVWVPVAATVAAVAAVGGLIYENREWVGEKASQAVNAVKDVGSKLADGISSKVSSLWPG